MPKDKDRNRQQQHGFKQRQDEAMRQRQDETMRQQQNRGHLSPDRSESSQLSDKDKERSRQFERDSSDR